MVLGLLLSSNAYAEKIEAFCLVNMLDLRRANLSPEDIQRFTGKEIHFLINFDENLIIDISKDSELSLITGMYGPSDKKEFTKNNIEITYKSEIIVKGDTAEETIKYSYNNSVRLSDGKPTKLIVALDQRGISFNKWSFKINCRDYKYSLTEKTKASTGADVVENLYNKIKERKQKEEERKQKEEEEETNKLVPIIKDLASYKVNNFEDLLYLYKVKFFNNKINAGIELNTGDTIYFENVKDLNETEFFELPVKGKGNIMRKRKLKKEFLVKKESL